MAIQHYDWIEHHASYAPDSLAQQDLHSGRSFTYSQMHRRVEALAGFWSMKPVCSQVIESPPCAITPLTTTKSSLQRPALGPFICP